MGYLLGIDVGSSSIKAALLDAESGAVVASAGSPATELPILAPEPGFAEQDPATWWEHSIIATRSCLEQAGVAGDAVVGVGISYQMHGLVCLDAAGEVLRPSIIWCDSRAVSIGDEAAEAIGRERCLERLLNSPGNFTASKLAWVKQHQPELYAQIATIMLPGDWLAFRLTGERTTTASGLSEGILWDVVDDAPAALVMDHYGFERGLLPRVVPTFGDQGTLTAAAAEAFGLAAGTPVAYRGGDQPNNALSLGVLQPGQLAATAGTSGVVYGVADVAQADPESRVNTFVHVNHQADAPRYGVLLCVNGCGSCYSWLKREVATIGDQSLDYPALNAAAEATPIGADGVQILPFGNGAERTLGNQAVGAAMLGLDFNRHGRGHLIRAAQEGIACALAYGIEGMAAAGVRVDTVRAGHANLFLSPLFRAAFAGITGATVEIYDTDGAAGAARGAGIGAGVYADADAAFADLAKVSVTEPIAADRQAWQGVFLRWKDALARQRG